MSKKDFIGGLNSLLAGTVPEKPKKGRPQTVTKEIQKSSQEGTKENETRATFIVNEEVLDKLKAVAYWDKKDLKEIIAEALGEYLEKKKPEPRPEDRRIREQEKNQRLIRTGAIARIPKY